MIFQHENEYSGKEAPTCTQVGYTVLKCIHCGAVSKEKSSPALGHIPYVATEGYAATCEHTGLTDELICGRCEQIIQEQNIIPLGEHTPVVTFNGYNATCISEGLTDEISCSVCKSLIASQTVIPCIPHTERITKQGYPATCKQSGMTDEITCEGCNMVIETSHSIPALGHNDSDNDNLCDRCSYPIGEKVVIIKADSDLVKINENLNGIYLLDKDIQLSGDWAPIGSKESPFSGVFYGNGHTISGLTVNNHDVGGLFCQNKGIISNVNLTNIKITVENRDCIIGCLVGENTGEIVECNVLGNISITYLTNYSLTTSYQWLTVPSYKSESLKYDVTFGGICAVNNGKISNCNVDAKMSLHCSNFAKYTVNHNVLNPPGVTSQLSITDNIYCGGLVGKNNGTIVDCQFKGECVANVKVEAILGKQYGMCKATTETFFGSIVGLNKSQVSNCKGVVFLSTTETNKDDVFSASMIEQGHIAKHIVNSDSNFSGLIGCNNKGQVDNVSLL